MSTPFRDSCQNLCIHPAPWLAILKLKNRIFKLALKIPTVNKHLPVFLLGTELCIPLKIFAGLSKHLPVFLLGTEKIVGGCMAILVVVCGKICGKMCGKIENCQIGRKKLCGSIYGPHDYDSGDKRQKKLW